MIDLNQTKKGKMKNWFEVDKQGLAKILERSHEVEA
jgi:hypothetical protein